MNRQLPYLLLAIICVLVPGLLEAQTPGGVQKLHQVLENVKADLIPKSHRLTDVARAVGAFGALWYIGYRVYKHIANAEPIDFFPLLKPFVLALLIGFYPVVLKTIDAVFNPMIVSTGSLVKESNEAVNKLLYIRAVTIASGPAGKGLAGGMGYGDNKDLYKYGDKDPSEDQGLTIGQAATFSFSLFTDTIGFIIKAFLSILLEVLYYAAALCIDAMRTFHLVILSLLGPFVLCLSMYDGFQHTLSIWLARYINVYLWLPIANLFAYLIGRIQQGMLRMDMDQTANGDWIGFGATDITYLIFLLIAILGYWSIPSIANYVVHASGGNPLLGKTNSAIKKGGALAVGAFTGGAGTAASVASTAGSMAADRPGNDMKFTNMADAANSEPYFKDPASNYQAGRISG